MSSIVCKKCKSPAYLNLQDSVRLVATFGLGPRGVKVGLGDLTVVARKFTPQFYCLVCKSNIPSNDLMVYCQYCGEEVAVKDAFKGSESPGLFCVKHKGMAVGAVVPGSEVIKNASLNERN
jgi:DNA-directed RNA polymerase subunit RPC12/RpoP